MKLLFVTDRFTGVGSKEPSPVIVEDKDFTLVKNLQLSRQLLEVFCNRKQTRREHNVFRIRKVNERERGALMNTTANNSRRVHTYAGSLTGCFIRIRRSAWT